jgi:transmembrane sensor
MNKDYLLHKWMNGEATTEEAEQLKSFPEYASYIKIAEVTSHLEAPLVNSQSNYDAISSKTKSGGKIRTINPLATLLKIAAVVAVVLASYFYFTNSNTTVRTQIAEKQKLQLPDNSEVVLNANSEIKYNRKKWNNQRELTLNGEAYFKVTKGSTFKVKTSSGVVSVLGTQFNVFSRDKAFYINCYEGLVSVAFSDTLIKLPAGTKLMVEDGLIKLHDNFSEGSPSWTKNESSFENASITMVLQELERQYSIKLTAKFNSADLRFTGSFTHGDLDLALKSICNPLHLAYTIEEESVTIYAKDSP